MPPINTNPELTSFFPQQFYTSFHMQRVFSVRAKVLGWILAFPHYCGSPAAAEAISCGRAPFVVLPSLRTSHDSLQAAQTVCHITLVLAALTRD